MTKTIRNWIYGVLPADQAVYLPEDIATRWALLLDAYKQAETWQQFWDGLDTAERESIASVYEEDGVSLPRPGDPLQDAAIPGFLDYEWPGQPGYVMAAALPHEVLSRHAHDGSSPANTVIWIDASEIPEINAILEQDGATVRRDDNLIVRATWRDK